jgi:ubiquinone/menaquinone biosynthesis C-methylase UbiE
MKRKIKTMLKLAGFSRGDHLLDVGCASGVYTFELAKMGFRMTGLDLSPECIHTATHQAGQMGLSNIDFVVGDAEALSQFENNTFDGAISFSALRYVPNPDKAIQAIYRVLAPGGRAVVDFPNKRSPWFKILKPLLTGETHIHDHQYTTRQVKRMLKTAGFQDVHLRRILYTPKSIPDWILPIMKVIDFIGERTPILKLYASIVMGSGNKR